MARSPFYPVSTTRWCGRQSVAALPAPKASAPKAIARTAQPGASVAGCARALMPPGDDLEPVEAALDRAVEQRRASRGLQSDQLRQPRVAGEQVRGPAGEALLQRVAELRIHRRQRRVALEPHAVGRIGDQHAGARGGGAQRARRRRRRRRSRRRRPPPRCAGRARRRGDRRRWRRSPARRVPAARGRARAGGCAARSGRRTTRASGSRRSRASPGARPAAISAASMAMVPLPHIGSSSGVPGVHPESAIRPAARFSRSGAASASRR